MLVGKVAFDMQDFAQCAALDHVLQLAHGSKTALVVAAAKRHTGAAAGVGGTLRLGACESEGLFAPDRLAGRRDSGHLGNMQRMRRSEEDGVDFRVSDRHLELGRQPQTMLYGKIANQVGLLAHPVYETQSRALALDGAD